MLQSRLPPEQAANKTNCIERSLSSAAGRQRHSEKSGSSSRLLARNGRSLDDERRLKVHGPRHVVEVGRRRHHCRVDLGELLLGAATFDADGVAQVLVARGHGWIDPEETAE